MSRFWSCFFENLFWPLVVLSLGPVLTLLGSKILSGTWLTWFKIIPFWGYVTFFGLTIGWLLISAFLRRRRILKEKNTPRFPCVLSGPALGYKIVGSLSYKNVIWQARIPASAPWLFPDREHEKFARIDIEVPPHCPKCDTEMEEKETFWGKFLWSCIRCGYKVRNEYSFYSEAVRAEKLAQSHWQEQCGKGKKFSEQADSVRPY